MSHAKEMRDGDKLLTSRLAGWVSAGMVAVMLAYASQSANGAPPDVRRVDPCDTYCIYCQDEGQHTNFPTATPQATGEDHTCTTPGFSACFTAAHNCGQTAPDANDINELEAALRTEDVDETQSYPTKWRAFVALRDDRLLVLGCDGLVTAAFVVDTQIRAAAASLPPSAVD